MYPVILSLFLVFISLSQALGTEKKSLHCLFGCYLEYLETLSESPCPNRQLLHLWKEFDKQKFTFLEIEEKNKARKQFRRQKEALLTNWRKGTGLTLIEDLNNKIEVHHIFHLSHGGPNIWWNLIPLSHQAHRRIHETNTPGEILHGKSSELTPAWLDRYLIYQSWQGYFEQRPYRSTHQLALIDWWRSLRDEQSELKGPK